MNRPKTNYGTARFVLGIIQFVGWAIIATGALVLIFGFSKYSDFPPIYVLVGSFVFATNGLVIIATAQLGLATIGSAENTQDILTFMQEYIGRSGSNIGSKTRIEPKLSL